MVMKVRCGISNLATGRVHYHDHAVKPANRTPLRNVILIGLTGNIASGKTEVARIFADLGATVIDADELARDVVMSGTPALKAIAARWGARVLNPDGTLNRGALRSIVFSDAKEREALNAIVHPEVKRLRDLLVEEARVRGDKVVVAAVPLLYEAGLEKDFDRVILVDAPDDVRLSRLVNRRGLSTVEAQRMMNAQQPASTKRKHAHVVIENQNDLKALRRAVERVWHDLTGETAR
jgi:dephospho-CoA kinase